MNNTNNFQTNNSVTPPSNQGGSPVMQPNTTPNVTPQVPVQPQPQPVQPQPVVNPNPVAQPQVNVQPQVSVQPQPQQPQVVMPTNGGNKEVTVINTTRKKTSNIILVILSILLVFFVMNIDTVIRYYDNYVKTGSLTGDTTEETDNLVNGYILIDDSNSSIRVENINFYKFRKSGDTTLSFNYTSKESYDDSSSLGIYIEIYNSNKELLYKKPFIVDYKIESNSVRIFNLEVDNYTYSKAYFALIKKYTDEEKNSTSKLTCTFTNDNVNYKIVYNFTNKSLDSYEVDKELLSDDAVYKSEIEKEYNSVKEYVNATYKKNKLNYSVDLKNIKNEFNPLYLLNTTPLIIKEKEELKKWKCE